MRPNLRSVLTDVALGGVAGGIVGAIVAVNVVIFAGVESGYEANLGEVFAHSTALGIAVLAIFAAGPVLGVVAARRIRARRKG